MFAARAGGLLAYRICTPKKKRVSDGTIRSRPGPREERPSTPTTACGL